MNILKWIMMLAVLIEWHYRCHKINISLRPHSFLRDCQRYIFEIIPLPGTRTGGIFERADDIQAAMPIPLPLFQPFRKGTQIFLAVSMVPVGEVSLMKMLSSPAFRNSDEALPVALGYDLAGEMVIEDLDEMVHALYVGAPNSGKSTGLMCMILSLICTHPASEVNLIIFDVGADTLDVLDGIPQLSHPIVKNRDEGAYVIQSLVDEMGRRYGIESSQRRDLPTIVCVMDEFISYIDSFDSRRERQIVVSNITDLLRRGRKVKIRLVLATQEPKNDKMEVEIRNITSRMAFRVDRHQTSSTILNHGGAEKLPGKGAMLYRSANYPKSIYVQGAFISDDEAAQLVERIKASEQDFSNMFVIPEVAASDYLAPLSALIPAGAVQTYNGDEQELASIILWTLTRENVSSLKIKEIFKMGNRADAIIDKLCEFGLISEKFSNQPRTVLPQSVEDIPDKVMAFMARWGKSAEDIAEALSKRSPDDVVDHGEEPAMIPSAED